MESLLSEEEEEKAKNANKKRSPWFWGALICLGLILLVLLIMGIIYAALPSSDSSNSSVVASLNDGGGLQLRLSTSTDVQIFFHSVKESCQVRVWTTSTSRRAGGESEVQAPELAIGIVTTSSRQDSVPQGLSEILTSNENQCLCMGRGIR